MLEPSRRHQVEAYLRLHSLEPLLDLALNEVLEEMPTSPCLELARVIAAKSHPEIVDVRLHPVLTAGAGRGVQACLVTNIGRFTGSAAVQSEDVLDSLDAFLDPIRQIMVEMDPTKSADMDALLASVKHEPAHRPILMCISIACTRAAASHRGIALYRYISSLAGDCEMCIPLPVVTVLSIARETSYSNVHVLPTQAVSLEHALDCARTACALIRKQVTASSGEAVCENRGGSVCVTGLAVDAVVRAVRRATAPLEGELLLSLDAAGDTWARVEGGALVYDTGDPAQESQSSQDRAAALMALWRETALVSLEDPFHADDSAQLVNLRNRMVSALQTSQGDGSLSHARSGVGGSEACLCQVVADEACSTAEQVKALPDSINAVKLRLDKFCCVSDAVKFRTAARKRKVAVVAGVRENRPVAADTFLSDLAVGLGVGQLEGGGLESGEGASLYNRLVEIQNEAESISFVRKYFRT